MNEMGQISHTPVLLIQQTGIQGEDRASDLNKVFPLGRCKDLDFHRGRCKGGYLCLRMSAMPGAQWYRLAVPAYRHRGHMEKEITALAPAAMKIKVLAPSERKYFCLGHTQRLDPPANTRRYNRRRDPDCTIVIVALCYTVVHSSAGTSPWGSKTVCFQL